MKSSRRKSKLKGERKLPLKRASAKPKSKTVVDLPESIARAYKKRYAKSGLVSGISDNITTWLDTGSAEANAVLGDPIKGIAGGRIIEMYSSESCGKTTISLWLAGLCQRAGGLAILADTENSYSGEWAELQGADVEDLWVIGLDETEKKNKKSGEIEVYHEGMEDLWEKVETIANAARKDPTVPVLIIIDSIASTPPRAELDGTYETSPIAAMARVMSRSMRRLVSKIRGTGVILLCLNQTRTTIGTFFPMQEPPGGRALRFHSSVRAVVKRTAKSDSGIDCQIRNMKNRLSPPFRTVDLSISFRKGLTWGTKKKKKKKIK